LKRARSGSSLWISGRAPALHALRVSLEPLPLSLIPSVCPREADAAALVGRVESAFHPAIDQHITRFRFYVKNFHQKFLRKASPALIRWLLVNERQRRAIPRFGAWGKSQRKEAK
jgi:hypothetical protein